MQGPPECTLKIGDHGIEVSSVDVQKGLSHRRPRFSRDFRMFTQDDANCIQYEAPLFEDPAITPRWGLSLIVVDCVYGDANRTPDRTSGRHQLFLPERMACLPA
jgi:hypothetical protein